MLRSHTGSCLRGGEMIGDNGWRKEAHLCVKVVGFKTRSKQILEIWDNILFDLEEDKHLIYCSDVETCV